jgi:8-oxo-dGTP pyrophosphatase MutT (NUDIX family)
MFEIPLDRLPPGFADSVEHKPDRPVAPEPAATVVLMRDGAAGPEALLLRRQRSSGFVPGAWVFPGGRVDAADSAPELLRRVTGLPHAVVPGAPFWVAAIREVFEETGVLLARDADGTPAPDAGSDAGLEHWREALMGEEATLADVLANTGYTGDASDIVPIAHWITPVVERRRYDTRFFLAPLPEGATARADAREMTDLVWLTPAEALRRFEAGELPMVFPTVRTLESLDGFGRVAEAADAFRGRDVPAVLPRLVRTESGVAIVIDD